MELYLKVLNHVEFSDIWIKYFATKVCLCTWFKAIAHIAFLELHKNKFCCCPCEILGWLEKVDLHFLKVWRSWMGPSIEDVCKFSWFLTLTPLRQQFFTTIHRQIWPNSDPYPPKICPRLKWMVPMNAAVWETSTFLSGREDFTAAAN